MKGSILPGLITFMTLIGTRSYIKERFTIEQWLFAETSLHIVR